MKNVLRCLVAAVLALAFAMPAAAAGRPGVTVTAGSAAADGTVEITVRVTDAAAVKAIAVVPTYDAETFALVSGTWLVSGALADFCLESGDGVLAFSGPTALDGAIFIYRLRILPGAQPGQKPVGCTVVLSSGEGENRTLTGSATVSIRCSHDFTQKDTDSRYLKTPATCTTQSQYYFSCVFCGEKGTAVFSGERLPHRYDALWRADAEAHWQLCQDCGQPTQRQDHLPGEDPRYCRVCDCLLAPEAGHTHDFSQSWGSTAQAHWGICGCGVTDAHSAHSWDEGNVLSQATQAQEGLCLYTCLVCGREKTQVLEKIYGAAGDGADREETEKQHPGLVAGAVLTALLCGGVLWVLLRKKKKTGSDLDYAPALPREGIDSEA